jgi:hypothetical protein
MDWQTGDRLHYTRNSFHGLPWWMFKVTNKQTENKFITHSFAMVITRMRLSITLYLHFLIFWHLVFLCALMDPYA